jgi:ABC-2 type transport system permease protein
MNGPLLRRTFRAQWAKLLIVAVGLFGWGLLMPVIYSTFGKTLSSFINSNPLFKQLSEFGGADLSSLAGAVQLGYVHPIAIALLSVFAIGFSTSSIAGERQRGTLEILLARPVSRRGLYLTLLVAMLLFIGIALLSLIAGAVVGSAATNVLSELQLANLPLLWLNSLLLFGGFGIVGLAMSASFDRLGPPVGIALAVLLVMYFLEIIGSLWPDARWLQQYSLFDYLQAKDVLVGKLPAVNVALLAAVWVVGIGYALWVFPRRDIAAPS